MRVTENFRYHQALRNLSDIASRHAQAAQEASSGRRIDAPSADPSGAAELVRIRSTLTQNAAFRTAAQTARSDAEMAESALVQAGDLLVRAHEIALEGGSGTFPGTERAILADEVAGIKAELVRAANVRGQRGYLFAGSQTNTPPFSSAGAFSGDDTLAVVDLGAGSPTVVGMSGERIFTAAGGRDPFADLDALEAALRANDPVAIRSTLPNIEGSRQQLTAARASSGLILNRLEVSETAFDLGDFEASKREATIANADPIESFSKLTLLSQALERSVTITKQLLDLGWQR